MKIIAIVGDLNPSFYFQSPYFCEVNSCFLGGNLYPFASEASPMLYENAWYFWRPEDKLFVGILHLSLYSIYIFEMSHKYVS